MEGFRDSEVDDLRHRLAVRVFDQDVAGLEVAVDDALLVRVLDRLADLHEQRQARAPVERVLVAEARERSAVHVLHHEVRPALFGGARVQHARDARMAHERERLPLRLEARADLLAVQAELDHLQGDLAAEGLLLLRQVDDAHAALTQGAHDAERPDRASRQRGRGGPQRGDGGRFALGHGSYFGVVVGKDTAGTPSSATSRLKAGRSVASTSLRV
jgi:hypothetical protein